MIKGGGKLERKRGREGGRKGGGMEGGKREGKEGNGRWRRKGGRRGRVIKINPQMTSWKTVTCLLVNFRGCQVLEKPVYVIQSVSALIPPPSSELWAGVRKEDGVWVRAFHSYCTICSVSIYHMCTWSSLDWFQTLWAGRSPVQYTKSNWNGIRRKNHTLIIWPLQPTCLVAMVTYLVTHVAQKLHQVL